MPIKSFCSFCLAVLLALVFAGCKKDNEDAERSKTDLLTTGEWIITSLPFSPAEDVDENGTIDSDFFQFLQPCAKDDYITFKRDGNAEWNEGASKCDPDDPQTSNSTWAFVNEEKDFLFDGERATIMELTESRFRIKFTDETTSPASTFEFVFSKK